MNYVPLKKDDFDKSFKFKNQSFLCYSEKKLKELVPDKSWKIVGLARKSDKDTESKLILGSKKMAVFDTEKDNPIYKNIGYLPIEEENSYIAIQESRLPFIAALGSMAAATAVICILLTNSNPTNPINSIRLVKSSVSSSGQEEPKFNPLPPVDTNIEDYSGSTPIAPGSSKRSIAPDGGGKVTLSYKLEAELKLESGKVKMEYQNPESSSHDAVVELLVVSGDKEYTVASSGRIPAGKQIKTMQLAADKKLFAGEGKYNAEYKVTYYDPITGEKALAEATITDVTLTVRR